MLQRREKRGFLGKSIFLRVIRPFSRWFRLGKGSADVLCMKTALHGRFPTNFLPWEVTVRTAGAWNGRVRLVKHTVASRSCQIAGSVSNYSQRWSGDVNLFKGAERMFYSVVCRVITLSVAFGSFSMAPKRKQDADYVDMRVESNKLEVTPAIHALLEVEGLLEFLEMFDGRDEVVAREFLENW